MSHSMQPRDRPHWSSRLFASLFILIGIALLTFSGLHSSRWCFYARDVVASSWKLGIMPWDGDFNVRNWSLGGTLFSFGAGVFCIWIGVRELRHRIYRNENSN
jgi:hypothetical protein